MQAPEGFKVFYPDRLTGFVRTRMFSTSSYRDKKYFVPVSMLENSQQSRFPTPALLQQEAARVFFDLAAFAYACRVEPPGKWAGVEWVSDSLTDLTGLTSESVNAQGWEKIIPSEDIPLIAGRHTEIFAGRTHLCEHRILTQKSGHIWVRNYARPTGFNDRQEVTRFVAVVQDITAQRQSQEAQRDGETRLRVALQAAPIIVYHCDRELRYTWIANPHPDFTEAQLLGKRDTDLLPIEDVREITDFKQQVLETEQRARQEIPFRSRGKVYHYDVTAEPLRDAAGKVTGLTVAAYNITQHQQGEVELAKLNERLRHSMTETHHRVKNSLQLISAYIEMQSMEHSTPRIIEEFARINLQVRAMAAVHDLLTEEAKSDGEAQRVSVRAVLEKLMPLLQGLAMNHSLTMELDDLPLSSRMVTSLALICNELVSNALKYGQQTASVVFRVSETEAVLMVTDDGAGFPEAFDATQKANTGLHLVQHLAAWDLSGSVVFGRQSAAGGGVVEVRFPLPKRVMVV